MMRHQTTDKLIPLMYRSWADIDKAVDGLTAEEATARRDAGSSIAWTAGHVAQMVDSWINTRIQGLSPHPLLGQPMFRSGGSGEADDWPAVEAAVREVREASRNFLDAAPAPDLDRVIAYDGSIEHLRSTGLTLRYALMRISAHHFVHVGEIVTIRSQLGHAVGDFPDWGRDLI
ncbi:MAG: DinB family protein, partial [bacterium]